jgi:hypothetical protein
VRPQRPACVIQCSRMSRCGSLSDRAERCSPRAVTGVGSLVLSGSTPALWRSASAGGGSRARLPPRFSAHTERRYPGCLRQRRCEGGYRVPHAGGSPFGCLSRIREARPDDRCIRRATRCASTVATAGERAHALAAGARDGSRPARPRPGSQRVALVGARSPHCEPAARRDRRNHPRDHASRPARRGQITCTTASRRRSGLPAPRRLLVRPGHAGARPGAGAPGFGRHRGLLPLSRHGRRLPGLSGVGVAPLSAHAAALRAAA